MWEGGTEREEAMKRAKKECVCCVYVLYSLAEGSCCYLACLPACLSCFVVLLLLPPPLLLLLQ